MEDERLSSLASDVMKLAYSRLVLNFRFLDTALDRLKLKQYEGTQATDGRHLYFDPVFVLKNYKVEQSRTAHHYLHSLLHCILYHPFVGPTVDRELWNFACDVAVEYTIRDMNSDCVSTSRSAECSRFIEALSRKLKVITAEKIYNYLKEHPLSERDFIKYAEIFTVDDHELWYRPIQNQEAESQEQSSKGSDSKQQPQPQNSKDQQDQQDEQEQQDQEPQQQPNDPQADSSDQDKSQDQNEPSSKQANQDQDSDEQQDGNGQPDESTQQDGNGEQDEKQGQGQSSSQTTSSSSASNASSSKSSTSSLRNAPDLNGSGNQMSREEMMQDWKDISEKMFLDLQTTSQDFGNSAGALIQNLQQVNRERYDYTEFLRKFAVMKEDMQVNPDEFDYIAYTHGLTLYKNMPLIEPLEYREVKRIREFVIAIDVSGSVQGDIVQNFIQKTYNILQKQESFFTKINLHIIQCDAKIQSDVKITSREEFDKYLKTMVLKGFGGTDFRPVFTYVQDLINKGEFTNLKGLIYFTDGYGTFPRIQPPYTTAFVMLRDDTYDEPEVPVWAVKLVLEKDDLKH